MWKYRSKFVNIVIVCFIFNLFVIDSFASVNVPEYLKIGLEYGSSALPKVDLSSDDGFDIGVLEDGSIEKFIEINENRLTAKNEESIYYIKIEQDYDDIQDALNIKQNLSDENIDSFVFYDGNFKVYIGSYLDQDDAQNYKDEISDDLSDFNLEVVSSDYNFVQIMDGDDIIFMYDSNEDVCISSKDGIMGIKGKKYRGSVLFKRSNNNNMTVINRVGLDEYLYGVVPREMSGGWPIEALKAQSIAARNYAIMNMGKYKKYGFDLTDDTFSQVYGGYGSEHPNSNRAVDGTRGQIMVYNGKIVDALYHSNSGGKTEDSENVWSNKVPYLRGVEDSYSLGYPNDNWTVSMTKEDIKNKLSKNKVDIGTITDVKIEELSENDRVIKIKFIGTDGEKEYTKDSTRTILGLKSNYYDIVKAQGSGGSEIFYIYSTDGNDERSDLSNVYAITSDGIKDISSNTNIYLIGNNETTQLNLGGAISDKYAINGHGWGHGLGMSQYGAKEMAKQGFSYEDILKHYYKGIEIQK
ncbi:SpoIID/LytB domain-containing protein [Tepidibacter hydrothermalis]|uniref:SpoIID/LytB domain-containing protein n=1 Tax=Tepidibacter hydrothermalis TaxID=3036126 RepID=A0ABY8EEW5_9FIRM|nr:SpoIID/LytB domain-containing protein [Tepidibacter hydrothermalis]WFD09268.1 SpoIID/LytB domain-containing protein [Tepidibacter hydrothermalis]